MYIDMYLRLFAVFCLLFSKGEELQIDFLKSMGINGIIKIFTTQKQLASQGRNEILCK